MGFVVAPGDFRVGNSHAMGNRCAADVNHLYLLYRMQPLRQFNRSHLQSTLLRLYAYFASLLIVLDELSFS